MVNIKVSKKQKQSKEMGEKLTQLKAHIDRQFNKAVDGRSEKTIRWQEAWMYYLSKLPEKKGSQQSSYVEPIVRRAVETLRPSIMNLFTENEKKAVSFRPTVFTAPGVSEAIDAQINKIFLNENDGYNTVEKAITEALVSGDTFLKVFNETVVIEEDPFTMEKMPSDQLAAMLEEYPDTDLEGLEEDKEGLLSGTIIPTRIEEKIRIQGLDFKDVFVEGSSEDIRDASYVGHRYKMMVGDLIEAGYDEDVILKAASRFSQYDALGLEKIINQATFTEEGDDDIPVDEMTREVYIYEHYIYSSLFNDKKKRKPKLLQVMATNEEILEINEIDIMPFIHGVVDRVPGSFWGISLYDKLKAEQDALSHLHRIIEDTGKTNAYGRYVAVKGSYDKQSLLNNRPGGVIEVDNLASIKWFEDKPIPDALVSTVSRLNDTVEKTLISSSGVDLTGAANVSATAAAITQNNAEMKDKQMARVIAYSLFKPMFEIIYSFMRVGTDLPTRAEFIVDVNTANDEALLGQQLVNLCLSFAQLSQANLAILQPNGMIEIAKTATGLSDEEMSKYLSIPQPDPMQMEMQARQAQLTMQTQEEQLDVLIAQKQLAAAQVIKTEVEIAELIKDGENKRTRSEEQSVRDFKKIDLEDRKVSVEEKSIELKETEMLYEMSNPGMDIKVSR